MTLRLVEEEAIDVAALVRADTTLLRNLAEVHQKFGMHNTAINMLHLSLWIDRDDVEALALLAKSFFKTHKFSSVLSCLNRIEELRAPLSDAQNIMRLSALVLSGHQDPSDRLASS